ncbi:MAG TPA: sirohydrochlorin chelatase [Thermoplasmata archaeon]|nr:sirohydrochlorin chelatase [Thermoplasmata archaeon]
MREALVLIGHGSRLARANEELREIAAMVRDSGAYDDVRPAYLGNEQPDIPGALTECAAAGAERIIAMPYFLFEAGHVKEDIPEAIALWARGHGTTQVRIVPPLGTDDRLIRCVLDRADAAVASSPKMKRLRRRHLILVARGSSDPALESGLAQAAMRAGVMGAFPRVSYAFTDTCSPTYEDEARRVIEEDGAKAVVLQPFALFSGEPSRALRALAPKLQKETGVPVASGEAIGADPRMVALVIERSRAGPAGA